MRRGFWAAAILTAIAFPSAASAESLREAMASSYVDNPTLNAFRAQLRAIDEAVPQARAGHRPSVSMSGSLTGAISQSNLSGGWSKPVYTRSVGLSVQQPIFLGFRTKNSIKMAKTSVLAGREQLKSVEQGVLLDTVSAFMDVVRAQAVLNLRAQNVTFLQEQVRAATDRLNVGEGTRTDLAQANASLAAARSSYAAAVADLNRAIATYIQVVGHRPTSLGAVGDVDRLLPKTLDAALALALAEHPDIVASVYNIDVGSYNVKIAEGALLPSVNVTGSISHSDTSTPSGTWSDSASVVGSVSVPIYQGGGPASQVRELKETLGQLRINLDATRAAIRQNVVASWATLDAARAQVTAAAAQVAADRLALEGVIEERNVGQRTTLDVLNAQQDLLNGQVLQVQAQFDRVVAAFALLAAVGKLNATTLSLNVTVYDPTAHYNAVKDKWHGLRTPDGR